MSYVNAPLSKAVDCGIPLMITVEFKGVLSDTIRNLN